MRKKKEEELNSYIKELKTTQFIEIPEPAFLTVKRYECILNNGKKIVREKMMKNKRDGDAAIVLSITKENTVILTVQPRVFTKSTVGISLPAGYKEEDETYMEAAIRELKEETGYVPKKIKEVCSFYQDEGCSSAYNKGFIALDCERVGDQKLDESEFIKFFECTLEELSELVEKGFILDGGSCLVIEKSKKYLKKRGKKYV